MYFAHISISFMFISFLFTCGKVGTYETKECLVYGHADRYWSLKKIKKFFIISDKYNNID